MKRITLGKSLLMLCLVAFSCFILSAAQQEERPVLGERVIGRLIEVERYVDARLCPLLTTGFVFQDDGQYRDHLLSKAENGANRTAQDFRGYFQRLAEILDGIKNNTYIMPNIALASDGFSIFLDMMGIIQPQREIRLNDFRSAVEEKEAIYFFTGRRGVVPEGIEPFFLRYARILRDLCKFETRNDIRVDNRVVCTITGSLVGFSDISRERPRNVWQISLIASQVVFADSELDLPGVHLLIRSPKSHIIKHCSLSLRGSSGEPRVGQNVYGLPGNPGKPGGTFVWEDTVIKNQNDFRIHLDVSGGDGGKGQNGRQGAAGDDGKPGKIKDLIGLPVDHLCKERKFCIHPNERSWLRAAWEGQFVSYTEVYVSGTEGNRGNDGANAGRGGFGGNFGNVLIPAGFNRENNSLLVAIRNPGKRGNDGKPGEGGLGGRHGGPDGLIYEGKRTTSYLRLPTRPQQERENGKDKEGLSWQTYLQTHYGAALVNVVMIPVVAFQQFLTDGWIEGPHLSTLTGARASSGKQGGVKAQEGKLPDNATEIAQLSR